MKRPNIYDKNILQVAMEKFAPKVIQITGDDNINEVIDDLTKSYDPDGYKMAKRLEDNCSWDPNSELVECLNGAFNEVNNVFKETLKNWVELYQIKSKYGIGQKVLINYRAKEVEGEISRIDKDTAQYLIYCKSLNHVKEGQGTHGAIIKEGQGTHGTIINYEDIKPIGEIIPYIGENEIKQTKLVSDPLLFKEMEEK